VAGNIFRGRSTLIAGAEKKKSSLFETLSTGKTKFVVKYRGSAEGEGAIATGEALVGTATAAIGVAETKESAAISVYLGENAAIAAEETENAS